MTTNDVPAEQFASSSSISRRRITMEYSGGVLPGLVDGQQLDYAGGSWRTDEPYPTALDFSTAKQIFFRMKRTRTLQWWSKSCESIWTSCGRRRWLWHFYQILVIETRYRRDSGNASCTEPGQSWISWIRSSITCSLHSARRGQTCKGRLQKCCAGLATPEGVRWHR